MGISIASGDTEAGSSGPNRPEKPWRLSKCSSSTKVVDISVNVQRQVPTGQPPSSRQFEPRRQQRKSHMFHSLTEWRKSLSWCRCQQRKRHRKLWKFTERTGDVPVVQEEQVQQSNTGTEDPKVQTTMFRPSRLQKMVKVLQVQVIDEAAKVPRSMRRQDPLIQEMQKDQKPEEVQTSFSPYLEGGMDKAEVQTKTLDPRCTVVMMPDVREVRVRKRARRLHQTCRLVDPCAHV